MPDAMLIMWYARVWAGRFGPLLDWVESSSFGDESERDRLELVYQEYTFCEQCFPNERAATEIAAVTKV